MWKMHQNLFLPWFTILAVTPLVVVHAQRLSLPGIFSAMRYQNTVCEGENEESGVCLYENECLNRKGAVIGRCANGFAACCSFKFTCGGETGQNETLFVNRQYPAFENDTNTCQVTIKKMNNICQLRLDFEEFTLSQPDENGFCTTDSFMVRTTVGERLPIICGENAGQHIYVDMGQGSTNPVVLSIVTNGIKILRKWKIKINMILCDNLDMAPSGCLQYYRSPTDIIRSFNYGPKIEYRARYLSNMRYTACIRTEENFCAIKWETAEPGSFMFGAPFEGRENDFNECSSHSFPFFGMHGKTNDGEAQSHLINNTIRELINNVRTSTTAVADTTTTIARTSLSPSTTTTSTAPSIISVTSTIPNSNTKLAQQSIIDGDTLVVTKKNNATIGRTGKLSDATLPGVLSSSSDRDQLYPHRLCNGGASGALCNFDDFIGIDQGSIEGTGQGEDRFCGAKLLEHDFIISRSKPFQIKIRSNGDHFSNAINSQSGFALKYTQLPCVI